MKFFKYITVVILGIVVLTSCNDDDTFSSDYNLSLTFSKDTLSLDTVFANTLSGYKSVMLYNNNGDGMRISNITQKKGYNSTGFLVNVNGSFIDPEQNNQLSDMEIRNGDSIRVFVEFKPKELAATEDIKEITDEIVFTFESGKQQSLFLKGKVWNANKYTNLHVTAGNTMTFPQGRPVILYGMVTIDEGAELKLQAGDTLYFHHDAGIDCSGTLTAMGTKEHEILLRCDRLDSLLQLKYDNVPGKWKGIHLYPSSTNSQLSYFTVHGSEYGIVCDTTSLVIDHSTIHNISGVGIQAKASTLTMKNVQLSNARDNCLDIQGGNITVNSSTIASFYAYESGRLHAISFTDKDDKGALTPLNLHITNTIITGYDDDEVWYTPFKNDSTAAAINLDHCLLRTEKPDSTGVHAKLITNSIFENLEDTINGWQNFKTFDTYNFFYDFTPKKGSKAIEAGDAAICETDDRKGVKRKPLPDLGAFETTSTQ